MFAHTAAKLSRDPTTLLSTSHLPFIPYHRDEAKANLCSRHRRTHEARPDGEMGTYTDDDLEAEENEFGALDDESPPPPDHGYMQAPMSNMNGHAMRMPPTGMTAGHAGMPPPMMTQHQLMPQQI